MAYYLFFLILGVISLTAFLRERVKSHTVTALLKKTVTSVLFLAAACTAACILPASSAHRSFPFFVIGGLFFGLLGDIWLDLKFVYPKDSTIYTYAGFCVFGTGHVLYMTGMVCNYKDLFELSGLVIVLVSGLVIGIVNGMLGKIMKLEYGKFRPVVMLYGGSLFMMTLLSGYLAWKAGLRELTLNFMFVGGVLFLISDLILSGTYFGEGRDKPADIIANHIFYYAAQFIIAGSLLFVK